MAKEKVSGDIGAQRDQYARSLGTFSGVKDMTASRAGWKGMTKDTAMDSFPQLRGKREPAGNSVSVDVNVGSGLAPKKADSMKGYEKTTPPPKGRALPVRGEGPTRNFNR